jgi:hypothetical protein
MDSSSRDDIDIQELAVRIIRYLRNHFVFIVVACATGIGLGIAAYKALPNHYESQMVVLSDLLTKTYGDRMDESLNKLISEGNTSELSKRLNLSPEKVGFIQSVAIDCQLDVKTPQREKVEKDETYFTITVDLADPSVLPEIQDAMLYYLRNNEWVKTRAAQRARQSTAIIQRIDREIQTVDSLKRVLFQKGPLRMESIQFDPTLLYTGTIELTRLKWKEQQELELSGSIHLIEGFTVFQKPKDPKLATLVVLGFILGLAGAIGLLTVKHLIKLSRS